MRYLTRNFPLAVAVLFAACTQINGGADLRVVEDDDDGSGGQPTTTSTSSSGTGSSSSGDGTDTDFCKMLVGCCSGLPADVMATACENSIREEPGSSVNSYPGACATLASCCSVGGDEGIPTDQNKQALCAQAPGQVETVTYPDHVCQVYFSTYEVLGWCP